MTKLLLVAAVGAAVIAPPVHWLATTTMRRCVAWTAVIGKVRG
jgi:hypothetical protein